MANKKKFKGEKKEKGQIRDNVEGLLSETKGGTRNEKEVLHSIYTYWETSGC